MAKKHEESNLLPFLLGAGAVAAAGLAYKKYKESKEQTTDDIAMFPGGGYSGIGGSGDFYGNSSSVEGGIPVVNPMLYPDSMDAGIEDIARGDANLGITDVSDGGVNPTNYGTDGNDIFNTIVGNTSLALTVGGAAASAAGYGLTKASNAASKAAQTASRSLVSKTTGSAATAAAGKVIQSAPGVLGTAGKAATTVGRIASPIGWALTGIEAIGWALDGFGIQDHIDKNGLTLPVAGFGPAAIMSNVGSQVMKNVIPTDKAASEAVGNVQTENTSQSSSNTQSQSMTQTPVGRH